MPMYNTPKFLTVLILVSKSLIVKQMSNNFMKNKGDTVVGYTYACTQDIYFQFERRRLRRKYL